jgi:hypothetical protein
VVALSHYRPAATLAILAIFARRDKFSVSNALLIFVAFGSLVFIWGDWILATGYLKK